MKNTRVAAHLALLAVALFYAGNYIIAKKVMNADFLNPFAFVMLRVITATFLFWLLLPLGKRETVRRADIPLLILCGILGVAANQTLFFSGLERTTPVHASLIMTMCPVLVIIFAHFLLGDRVTTRKVGGILVGCIGAVILMTLGQEVSASSEYLWGDLLVLGNATSFSLYLVVVKRLTVRYSPLTVIRWVFTFGTLFVLPYGAPEVLKVDFQGFTTQVWLGIAYVLICVTFLAYLFNMYALKHVSPGTVSIYIYLQPLFASILSSMLGMEQLSMIKVIAGLLIFAGVYLVSDLRPVQRQKMA